ncbi:adhesive plaque matrix protein-like [Penaeus chinensis]|uniref:adhesive plaque matrix protein-like n=1 Tax=Penaeus chinensis TaxID=139456 RepID=UPI001FB5FDFB|nr:adhesive plaque matrix protein-like [Penaeus chinensis]
MRNGRGESHIVCACGRNLPHELQSREREEWDRGAEVALLKTQESPDMAATVTVWLCLAALCGLASPYALFCCDHVLPCLHQCLYPTPKPTYPTQRPTWPTYPTQRPTYEPCPTYPTQRPTYPTQIPTWPPYPPCPTYPTQRPTYPTQIPTWPTYPTQRPTYPTQIPTWPTYPPCPTYPTQRPTYPTQIPTWPTYSPCAIYPTQRPTYPTQIPTWPTYPPCPTYPTQRPTWPPYPTYQPCQTYPTQIPTWPTYPTQIPTWPTYPTQRPTYPTQIPTWPTYPPCPTYPTQIPTWPTYPPCPTYPTQIPTWPTYPPAWPTKPSPCGHYHQTVCPYAGRKKRSNGQRRCSLEGHCPHGYSCCPNGCPGKRVCVLSSPSYAPDPQTHETYPHRQVNVSLIFTTASTLSHWLLQYQVLPVQSALPAYVSLEQVPFSNVDQSGECPYGSSECLGNMLVSCVVWHMQNQSAALSFASCLTANTTLLKGGSATPVLKKALKCMEDQPKVWNKVATCVSTEEGPNLLMAARNRQKEFGVAYNGNPIVAFNGEVVISNVEDLDKFMEFVCFRLRDNKKVQSTCRYLLQDTNVVT